MSRLRVAIAALPCLLAACTVAPPRPQPPVPASPAGVEQPAETVEPTVPVEPVHVGQADASPWDRLRQRLRFAGCDDRAGVRRETAAYARSPGAFAASWKPALPTLLLVLDEIERRDLPGEFALLPYVESGYRALPSSGNRVAGMWQLMPGTARSVGLIVRPDYDERLDPVASTRAALDLIERYERVFADWRLATMAFNAGEFRVRRVLAGDGRVRTPDDLARLPLSSITHQHLDRMAALACILAQPARFEIELPEPDPAERLQVVALDAPMDLRLAARLADVPAADVRAWNAAYRRDRMPADAAHWLLLPTAAAQRLRERAAAVPGERWADWHERRIGQAGTLAEVAARLGVTAGLLAAANGRDEAAHLAASDTLLVPGVGVEAAQRGERTPRVHVVASGDTLWTIARRHRIPLRELMRLNPRAHGTLRIGLRLRLTDEG